jgi:hypothetical protein
MSLFLIIILLKKMNFFFIFSFYFILFCISFLLSFCHGVRPIGVFLSSLAFSDEQVVLRYHATCAANQARALDKVSAQREERASKKAVVVAYHAAKRHAARKLFIAGAKSTGPTPVALVSRPLRAFVCVLTPRCSNQYSVLYDADTETAIDLPADTPRQFMSPTAKQGHCEAGSVSLGPAN